MASDGVFIPCHRCGHRSEVIYTNGPEEWDFCGHHGREHQAKMSELGFARVLLSDDCDTEVVRT